MTTTLTQITFSLLPRSRRFHVTTFRVVVRDGQHQHRTTEMADCPMHWLRPMAAYLVARGYVKQGCECGIRWYSRRTDDTKLAAGEA